VIYDRLPIVTLIAYLQLSSTCIHIVTICVTAQIFILLFGLCICSCSYHIVSSPRVPSLYTHTHYGRVLTTLGLHVQLLDGCSNVQVFDELVHFASWTLSPSLHSGTLISPSFLLLHDSICIAFNCHFLPIIHIAIMCSFYMSYCSDFHGLDYSLFRLQFRLSAYTWGFFLTYMRRHNVSVSLGSGRYIVVSEPGFRLAMLNFEF